VIVVDDFNHLSHSPSGLFGGPDKLTELLDEFLDMPDMPVEKFLLRFIQLCWPGMAVPSFPLGVRCQDTVQPMLKVRRVSKQ